MIPLELNRPVLGCFVNWPSPHVVELIGAAGMDFVVVDMEHGAIDWETLEHLIVRCEAASTPCIVRVPERRRECVLRALDCGASGIQMPMINTKAEAEELIRLAKYPPEGIRGAAFTTRAARYGLIPDKSGFLQSSNENTRVVMHVETPQAVNHLDEILTVQGVDVIFIGPTDLSVSMGYAHDMNHPEVVETIRQVTEKALAAGKTVGIMTRGLEELERYKQMGITYLCTSIQTMLFKVIGEYRATVPR